MKQFANAKGCPFCGSDRVEPRSGFGIFQVKCHRCGARFRFVAETDEQFIKKWNRRAQTSERDEVSEDEAQRELEQIVSELPVHLHTFLEGFKMGFTELLKHAKAEVE